MYVYMYMSINPLGNSRIVHYTLYIINSFKRFQSFMSGQKLMNAQRMLTTAMLRLFALILLDRFPAPATQGIQGMENSVQVR